MQISEAAKRAGVGVETVRFYELKGLINQPPRPESGGYREYSEQEVRRIFFVRSAQQLGFSLNEIGELSALATSANAECVDIRHRASTKLQDIVVKIENLKKIKCALELLIEACPGKGPARECSILDAINSGDLHLEIIREGD